MPFFILLGDQLTSVSDPIVIKKINPLRKAELPIIGIILFYLFMFYTMSAGDLGIMFTELFSFDNGIIGLTIAAMGFGTSVLLNFLQVAKISMTSNHLIASPRIGFKKKYVLSALDKCLIKWYENKAGRFPFIQFNFSDGKKLQIPGHQYKGLKPLILHLRDELGEKLSEKK